MLYFHSVFILTILGNAGKLVIQRTALKRASVHGCFSGGNSCDIYLWWILWISIYRMRRS